MEININTKSNKENFLNKKVKRAPDSIKQSNGKVFTKEKVKEGEETQSAKGINKFNQIEILFNKARELYEISVSIIIQYIIILSLFSPVLIYFLYKNSSNFNP